LNKDKPTPREEERKPRIRPQFSLTRRRYKWKNFEICIESKFLRSKGERGLEENARIFSEGMYNRLERDLGVEKGVEKH